MTGQQAITQIRQQAWTGRKPGLERTQALLAKLGNPEKKLSFIHLTGTNGKGSTAAMLASILKQSGYRTGLATSPHLYHFHERMQVNGANISDADLGAITERVLDLAKDMEDHPTEFELMTAVTMEYFVQEQCDIVVLEVGLGGRLDSTNVISAPEVAIVTNIGLEHTAELGNTITLIAQEKAGIIKTGSRCVLYQQTDEATDVIKAACEKLNVPLTITAPESLQVISSTIDGQKFTYRGEKTEYEIPLLGEHQLFNACVVLDAVELLRQGGRNISQEAVLQGLSKTIWPGRMERIHKSPDFILDGGHNPQCVQALSQSLSHLYGQRKIIFLAGVLADKDYMGMMDMIAPLAKEFITVTPDSPRALDGAVLAQELEKAYGLCASFCQDIETAVNLALEKAGKDDVICAFGSLYSAGEIRHCLGLC